MMLQLWEEPAVAEGVLVLEYHRRWSGSYSGPLQVVCKHLHHVTITRQFCHARK